MHSSTSRSSRPSMLIDFDNDTFGSIKKRMKQYKQKHGVNPKFFKCNTCKYHDTNEPLHYVHKGRDGIVFTDKKNTIVYKFVDKQKNVNAEYKCLNAMKNKGLSPTLKSVGKRSLTESFIHGKTVGDFMHEQEQLGHIKPAEQKVEQNFINFIELMIKVGVHNDDSNIYNRMITPSGRFQILDFSFCETNQTPAQMIAFFMYMFYKDRNSENLRRLFPLTTIHLQQKLCDLMKNDQYVVDKYVQEIGFSNKLCTAFINNETIQDDTETTEETYGV